MVQPKILKVKKLDTRAQLPTQAHSTDAGLDLYNLLRTKIAGHSQQLLRTGIVIETPKGHHLEIKERSGVSLNTALFIKAGMIDSDDRGEIKIIMANNSPYPVTIEEGEKIAQFIIYKDIEVKIEEDENLNIETERGEKGFGSSDEEPTNKS